MKTYKYETHLHTSQASACASASGDDYIEKYIQAGYAGIIVTDHFFQGNTCVPNHEQETWENRVNQYCSGYEKALKKAKELNIANKTVGTDDEFKVFFGLEQNFRGDEYLIYGLDKNWLLAHPEIELMSHKELFKAVNSQKGLMIQAHPFRFRDYIPSLSIHLRDIHGIEALNLGNKPEENVLAEQLAKLHNLPITAGSDIHHIQNVFTENGKPNVTGVEFETPLKDIFDYAERIKFGKGKIIR